MLPSTDELDELNTGNSQYVAMAKHAPRTGTQPKRSKIWQSLLAKLE